VALFNLLLIPSNESNISRVGLSQISEHRVGWNLALDFKHKLYVYRVGLHEDGNDECCSAVHVYNMHIL